MPVEWKSIDDATQAVSAYVQRHKQTNVVSVLQGLYANHGMIVLGDWHFVGDSAKSAILAKLITKQSLARPLLPFFAAFELLDRGDATKPLHYFMNAQTHEQRNWGLRNIPTRFSQYTAVLEAASGYMGKRCAIIPADNSGELDPLKRHEVIKNVFTKGLGDNVVRLRLQPGQGKGLFLLGAFHASRQPIAGGGLTTTGLLTQAGWSLHVVRTSTTKPSWMTSRPETFFLSPTSGAFEQDPINMLEILEQNSGGAPIYVPIRQQESPFYQLRVTTKGPPPAQKRSGAEFANCFDAMLHIPASWSGVA